MLPTDLHFYPKEKIPEVSDDSFLRDALVKMNEFAFGFCAIINNKMEVVGVFTDGDLRRRLVDMNLNFSALMLTEMKNLVQNQFHFVENNDSKEIQKLYEKFKVNEILLVNGQKQLLGVFRVLELRGAKVENY